jgi:invasion protein IalB
LVKLCNRAVAVTIVGAALGLSCIGVSAQTPAPKSTEPASTKHWSNTIGDWIVACAQNDQGKVCALSQTLSDAESKRVVAAWSFNKGAGDKVNAMLRGPLGVALAPGVQIAIDAEKPFSANYETCSSIGCIANFETTPALLAQLRKASKVSVVFQGVRGRPISLDFQMRGFSKAYDTYLQEAK